MKIQYSMKWALAALLLVSIANGTEVDEKDDEQNFNSVDDTSKTKRPFCNAFTGCGKKRNYYGTSMERSQEDPTKIQIPMSTYKALIRAVSQEIRNVIEHRGTTDDRTSEDQNYFLLPAARRPLRKRYQS